jgi:hypothetical protein
MSDADTQDVVAELDAWLADHDYAPDASHRIEFWKVQKAWDDIAALREALTTTQLLIAQHTRAEALEEAARVCDTHPDASIYSLNIAAAIRALKDTP